MTVTEFNRRLKPWMLPISMAFGVVFHNWIGYLAFLSPWLIFVMLLITYCKVSFANFRLDGSMAWLLGFQLVASIGSFFALKALNYTLAESVFICFFCPTATAAPVITGMLGGKIEKVATYSLLCNFVVACTAPFILAYMDEGSGISFAESLMTIAWKVVPLIIGPLIISIIMKFTVPSVRNSIAHHQGLSFYIWAFSLIIVVGTSVSFIMKEPLSALPLMLVMAALSLIACIIQFLVGNRIGRRYGDAVAGAQSLGQKNTVLAIWLALTYFNPISSVAPACYIVWHNIVNSWQIYRHERRRKN